MDFKNDIHLSLEASVNIVLKVHHKQLVLTSTKDYNCILRNENIELSINIKTFFLFQTAAILHFPFFLVCQWHEAGRSFSPVSSTIKTDRHDITEILLKVALNTITTLYSSFTIYWNFTWNWFLKTLSPSLFVTPLCVPLYSY